MLLVELRIFFSPFPEVIGFYKENTNIIMDQLIHLVLKCTEERMLHMYGSLQAEVHGKFSARFFEKTHVVAMPGSGFGPGGEGFVRVSAFGHRDNVVEACRRFKQLYKF